MASNLAGFLAQNAKTTDNEFYVASKRFVDSEGKPLRWEIRSLTSEDDEVLRKSCTKRVPIPGKRRGQFTRETDFDKYVGLLATACTVYPDLNNAELQDSYKVMGADTLLKTMLLPGEYADYLSFVQSINGFDVSFEEKVDEAKN